MRWLTRSVAYTLIVLIIGSVVPYNSRVAAVTASDWKAGRIIDDGIFTNANDMSVADIQTFLNNQVPNCDTNGTQPATEYGRSDINHAQYAASRGWPSPPYVCLRNYYEIPKASPGPGVPDNSYNHGGGAFAGGVSAAQMIANAAQQYQINPKVLLVKLRTESAGPLTNDAWPLQSQYTYAMGAHCPDSGPGGSANCDSNYAGFSIQMSESAALLRWYLDSMTKSWWQYKKPYQTNSILWNVAPSGCGAGNVYIESKATAALYTYTPYQPNAAALANLYGTGDGCSAYGNRNFWRVYNNWFGPTSGSFLVRTSSSSTYYLLTNGKRFAIPSGDILYAYGIEATPLTVVSDQYLQAIPDGGVLGTLFTLPGDSTVYLADGGKKIGIASGAYCVAWGLSCGDPSAQKEIGQEITNRMTSSSPLQPIMKFQDKYFLMQNGQKYWFITSKAVTDKGYNLSQSTSIINWTNAMRPFGTSLPEDKSFVKVAGVGAIYYYASGKFYGFADYDAYTSWAGTQTTCYQDSISAYNTTPPTTSLVLRQLVKNTDQSVHLINRTNKFILQSPSLAPGTFTDLNLDSEPGSLLTNKQVLSISGDKALATPGGTIFAQADNTLRPIPSMTDLWQQFQASDVLGVPSQIMSAYPMGKYSIASGRVIKPTGSGSLYIYGQDKNLWALGSMQELAAVNVWSPGALDTSIINIDASTVKIYAGIVSIDNTMYGIRSNGLAVRVASQVFAQNSEVTPLGGLVAARIPRSTTDVRFIRFDNGTIFYVGTNSIQPLASMSSYAGMGGSDANTLSLPLRAHSLFVVGNVIN